jgi:hypothetical protein
VGAPGTGQSARWTTRAAVAAAVRLVGVAAAFRPVGAEEAAVHPVGAPTFRQPAEARIDPEEVSFDPSASRLQHRAVPREIIGRFETASSACRAIGEIGKPLRHDRQLANEPDWALVPTSRRERRQLGQALSDQLPCGAPMRQ